MTQSLSPYQFNPLDLSTISDGGVGGTAEGVLNLIVN
jgi:hypothetical protein